MDKLKVFRRSDTEQARWLADKIPALGDYAAEAAHYLVKLADALDARQSSGQGSGEAVAWQIRDADSCLGGGVWVVDHPEQAKEAIMAGCDVRPLTYAHPPAAAARIAEPFVHREAYDLLNEAMLREINIRNERIAALESQLTESREREGRMRESANKLLRLLPLIDCDDLHHPKHKRHGFGEKCPVEAEYNNARQNLAALAAEKEQK